ncbi:RNA polymerase sigma factor [Chondrinema litorale]|uniref:RNA polymerase sigma factor n=1 Tax=Chondrinema litorale TaxID=2994555 RepID=UPI0025439C5B|nr:sigma-70 family RNA polymerase sigma factor [Chondrinema litorale]UZR94622.1 sigma-70 family RNA polymerase sigma factor [Chondrinema litorale]
MKEEIEDIIIDKIIQGDKSACRIIIDKYKSFVFNLAFRIVNNREDAEEVTQDSFIKAFKYLESFNRKAKFSTWLYRITFNTAVSKTRKKKVEKNSINDVPEAMLPIDSFEKSFNLLKEQQQKKYIHIILAKLSADERGLVTMYYLEEMPMEDISEATGLTKSNVKVKIHRARQKLYVHLSHLLKQEAREIL